MRGAGLFGTGLGAFSFMLAVIGVFVFGVILLANFSSTFGFLVKLLIVMSLGFYTMRFLGKTTLSLVAFLVIAYFLLIRYPNFTVGAYSIYIFISLPVLTALTWYLIEQSGMQQGG